MTILITGANGFVGRALCRALEITGQRFRRVLRNAALTGDISIGEIGESTDWNKAVTDATCVVHLAARTHVLRERSKDPIKDFRGVNVKATANLARACMAAGVKRLVYLSSVKVNGECTTGEPFSENDTPLPADPYGISKWEAEQELFRTARSGVLEIVVLRPPLVYGPWVGGNFLRLLDIARRGWPLPFASINNSRSLLFIENLVTALIACITQPQAAGKTYLVSDGTDISTPDLFRQLSARMGVSTTLFPFPPPLLRLGAAALGRNADATKLLASLQIDSSLIRRELCWTPPFSLDQGLDQTVRWYHSYLIEKSGAK